METQFKERALEYLGEYESINEKLGSGQEGFVYRTSRKTALKVFEREQNFNAELKSYQILQALQVEQIEGFSIPQLLGFDEDRLVIELTIVTAPYLLDFGKVHFSPPDFPSDAVAHDLQRCEEDFGEYWPIVLSALYDLQSMGIWYVDAKPSNINWDGLKIAPES